MRHGEPSRTMVQTAMLRAAHQLLDRPLIFPDPIAVGLVAEASEDAILRDEAHRTATMKGRRAGMALRSRFVEDRLAAAAARGVHQYVIAACGLDTFPWRQPAFARHMTIFAADLPASLAFAAERVRERGLPQPDNLRLVPVDLEQRRFTEDLTAHGLASDAPMFCSALGIVQFLSPPAVDALLCSAASMPPGSEIAFSFSPPDDELSAPERNRLQESVVRGADFGEPWLSRHRASELIARLRELGFRKVFHLTAELAQQHYFAERGDGLSASRSGQLIAAIV
jgi:methyltransferase (TIGR00027 family)